MRRGRYMDACPENRNCWGCFYAEECPVWLDEQDAEPIQIPRKRSLYVTLRGTP